MRICRIGESEGVYFDLLARCEVCLLAYVECPEHHGSVDVYTSISYVQA